MPGNSSLLFARYSRSTATVTSLLLHALIFGALVLWAWWKRDDSGPKFGARKGANLVSLAYIPSQEASEPEPVQFASLPKVEPTNERPLETKPLPRTRKTETVALKLPALNDPTIEAEVKPQPLAASPPPATPKPQTTTANKTPEIKRGELRKQYLGQNATLGSQGASEYIEGALHRPNPNYPLEMLRRKVGGALWLELHIAADGTVRQVVLIQSSGHPLYDEEAIKTAIKWRGTPARRAGVPVETIMLQEVIFKKPI